MLQLGQIAADVTTDHSLHSLIGVTSLIESENNHDNQSSGLQPQTRAKQQFVAANLFSIVLFPLLLMIR